MAPGRNTFSWWERRTRIEKCSLVIITLSAALIIYLASNLFMKFPSGDGSKSDSVCMTRKCVVSASRILSKMDLSANPCKDFYQFACGNYLKTSVIPDYAARISTFDDLSTKVEQNLKQIFEEPILDEETKSIKLVKTIYQSCMNTSRIEKEGLVLVKRIFSELGGFPVIDSTRWNENTFDWKNVLHKLRKIGWRYNILVNLYINRDMKNSSQKILSIKQPSMVAERLKKGFNDTYVPALYDFLVDLAMIFGANKNYAESEMREVIDFQINLAKITIPLEDIRKSSNEYNPMTIRKLQIEFPTIPWLHFINSFLAPVETLTSDDTVNVNHPKYLRKLENLLHNTKKRVVANYIFTRVLRDVITYLPENLRNSELNFLKIAYGQQGAKPRWQDCVNEGTALHVAVSSTYVKNYFTKETRNKITELVLDIKGAFIESLRKIVWMDRKTKKHAIIKADKMTQLIGFDDAVLDNSKVDQFHDFLELNVNGSYLEMFFNLMAFSHIQHVRRLNKNFTDDWTESAFNFLVNAFYELPRNSIELPAAILQEHFYDPETPQYLNYGAIGSIIGHEITHGFDDQGRQYDKDGNLLDWWEPETNKTFFRKSQCLIEQYSNLTIPGLGLKLKGVQNLGENIADNGGVKFAYRGYLRWLERHKGEQMLPGLPYSPRQMFWISGAVNFCTKYRKEMLKHSAISSFHSPAFFRVNVPFMNSDNFGRDFKCKLGSPMNPKYKCRVW